MTPEQPKEQAVQLQARWIGVEDTPVVLANQLLAQFLEGNVILTFGQVGPPPVSGTPEEQAEQLSQIEFLPIRALARYVIPPQRLREMRDALQTTLTAVERLEREMAEGTKE